ncbi:MAG TPA: MFS transporter, partial [Alphaproteobacteria bacterium]|nr:MFS transporter [Alphaproteobacteria bacterium]
MPRFMKPGRTVRWVVLATVMISMSMVAFEATIVATAMPQIVADLGGLTLYTWVFSSYLLTQTALTVVFGKLADVYGRKPIALLGIGVFLVGSLLAGFATSMPALIVFRLVQGVGAGAMQPAAMTIVADLYPGRERGRVQGYLSSVWAVSGIVGPLLGGLIVRNFAWSCVFWINLPVGLIAIAGYVLFLHEEPQHRRVSVDFAGAALAALAIASLMLLLTEASSAGPGFESVAGAVFVVSAVLFVRQERRAPDPM